MKSKKTTNYLMAKVMMLCCLGLCLLGGNVIYGMGEKPGNQDVKKSVVGVEIGQVVTEFSGVDSFGKLHRLSDYLGKIVVLEWKNHLCPFVRKHYESSNMQTLQKNYVDQGVIWLSVISSAKGKQGHVSAEECNRIVKKEGSHASAVILDEDGQLGRLFKAKTTPHMFVIDANGVLAYKGAIDSIRSAAQRDIPLAENFVSAALDALLGSKAVEVTTTKAYGCGVKY